MAVRTVRVGAGREALEVRVVGFVARVPPEDNFLVAIGVILFYLVLRQISVQRTFHFQV